MKIFGRDFSDRVTIEADHVWAEGLVREIGKHMPRMLRESPDRSAFWNWFCGEAESLFRHARNDEDRLYFQDLVNKTLEDAGLEERFDLTRRVGNPASVQPDREDSEQRRPMRHSSASRHPQPR